MTRESYMIEELTKDMVRLLREEQGMSLDDALAVSILPIPITNSLTLTPDSISKAPRMFMPCSLRKLQIKNRTSALNRNNL